MARTVVEALAQRAPEATGNGTAASAPAATRSKGGYRLTDPRGREAYIWWDGGRLVVEADDATFRRRVLRTLKKPIVSVEDEPDEFGVQWSTRKVIQPDDPLYPSRLLWSWIQIGLRDVKVQVVSRDDRQPVRFSWALAD